MIAQDHIKFYYIIKSFFTTPPVMHNIPDFRQLYMAWQSL